MIRASNPAARRGEAKLSKLRGGPISPPAYGGRNKTTFCDIYIRFRKVLAAGFGPSSTLSGIAQVSINGLDRVRVWAERAQVTDSGLVIANSCGPGCDTEPPRPDVSQS